MKTWEKVTLCILLPFAFIWYVVKKSAKYMERKSKPAIATLVAVTLMLSAMPISVFAVEDHTDHDGLTFVRYSNALAFERGGNFYLHADMDWYSNTIMLNDGYNHTLCLNGNDYYYDGGYRISLSNSSTFTMYDCRNEGEIRGSNVVVSVGTGCTFHLYSGAVNATREQFEAIKNNGDLNIYGGAVKGHRSIYNGVSGTLTLHNNPVIEGYIEITTPGKIKIGSNFTTNGNQYAICAATGYKPTEGNPVAITDGTETQDYSDRFTSYDANYEVVGVQNGNNWQVMLVRIHSHNYTYAAMDNVIAESCTCGHSETATIEIDEAVSTVYTGSQIKPLKVAYSEGWAGNRTAEISYSDNTDVGTASGTLTISGKTATKSFSITKKTADAPTSPTAQNSITYGAKLSTVGLTGGWNWVDGNTVPTVQNNGYTAYYTPADTANYDWTAVDGWNADENRVERTVAVVVNKATPEYVAPDNMTATYGDTLADVTLPDGWNWSDPLATSVGDVGTKTLVAIFTPIDTTNYQTVAVDVTVTVNAADASYTPPAAKENLVYSSIEKELVNGGTAIGGTLQYAPGTQTEPTGSWSTYVPVGKDAGTYYVWYKVVGDGNHNDVAPACITVTIAKAPLTVRANNKTIIYGDTPANDGVIYSGFMSNESAEVLGGTLDYDYNYTQYGDVGDYDITPKGLTSDNYEITFAKGTLTVEQKEIAIEWSNTNLTYNGTVQKPTAIAKNTVSSDHITLTVDGTGTNASDTAYTATVTAISGEKVGNYKLPADRSTTFTIEQQALTIVWGNSTFIYDGIEKFPAFNVEGIWNADDVAVTLSGTQSNASATAYTATITGLTGADAANYTLTGTLTREFTIAKAEQTVPAGLEKTDETIFKKADGTITGIAANMEYRKDGETTYTSVNSSVLENLAAGKYFVRYAADSNHNASPDTAVIIAAGRMLTVTVPQNQVGYTLTVDKTEIEYRGGPTITLVIADGYSKTENFAVKLNGRDMQWGDYTEIGTQSCTEDLVITVEGVADITAPYAEIDIKNNKWTSFWNGITFDLFFNETQDITTTATDAGSGVKSIECYLANQELELDEVRAITDWVGYDGTFKIDPNNCYVVYAKVTDNAGNTTYINSDGIILENVAPTLEGIENGKTYYGDLTVIKSNEQFHDIKVVTLDGQPMDFVEGTYGLIPADNAEHIVVVEDRAGNKTTYIVTVYKNYTVTFKVDGNTVDTQTVGYGKDATLPTIPTKDGYTQTAPTWDKDGKNITADTVINAVYAINEYTITFMDENGVYKTVTYKHGETVTAPDAPTKDGYTVKWETTIHKATGDATVKAVYTEIPKTDTPSSPQTGDNSSLWLWVALLFVSEGCLFGVTLTERKRRTASK